MQGLDARFAFPRGVAMGGPAGDVLFVADTGNNCIRCVTLPSGHTQTLAGSHVVKGLKDGVLSLASHSRTAPCPATTCPGGARGCALEMETDERRELSRSTGRFAAHPPWCRGGAVG